MDIVDKLLAACVGHPVTNIPWPHRVLHDAAEEITRLRAELAEANDYINRLRGENGGLKDALVSIEEYWNRDQNEKAMADACWHAVETAAAALAAKEGE